jgi:hypothetical protein
VGIISADSCPQYGHVRIDRISIVFPFNVV